jgi:hypothetical protein
MLLVAGDLACQRLARIEAQMGDRGVDDPVAFVAKVELADDPSSPA